MNFKSIILILIVFYCGNGIFAQSQSETKTINRKFAVSPVTSLDITNKYGKVHITTQDIDSVIIEVTITVTSPDKLKLNTMFKTVNVDFTATSFYINVKTIFESPTTSILSEIKKITDELLDSESSIRSDFTVIVPKYLNVKINNKYGDVFIDELKGNLDLKLSNGDFKIDRILGTGNIDVKFCNNGTINSMNNGTVLASYSDVTINNAVQLNLDTKSSKISIGQINVLKAISRRDKYYITDIKYFYGDTYFSDMWVNKFENELSFNMKYGTLNMETIDKKFAFIQITSAFTDINLYFPKLASYKLEITHKSANLQYPKELAELTQSNFEGDIKKFILSGKIGKTEPTGRVKISCESSGLNIYHH